MATFSGKSVPTLNPELRGQQELIGRWTLATDGQVTGTYKSIGALPAGAMIDATSLRAIVETVWNGTTPLFDLYLVPHSTGTVATNAILPTSQITEGTTGIYYSTAALVKTAAAFSRLTEPHEVVILGTFGDTDNTTGDITFVLPFSHDLDPTTY